MSSRNEQVIAQLVELTRLTTLEEGGPQSFRVRAYENAVSELREHRGELEGLSEAKLTKIAGVGRSTAKKILEYFETGKIDKLEKLRAKFPPAFVELTQVPGLGPKSALLLRKELGVGSLDGLRGAIETQAIRNLAGFGEKSESNLADALERMGALGKNRRRTIAETLPLGEAITAKVRELKEVTRAQYCGSLRRFRETIADIDIVAASEDGAGVMDAFVALDFVAEVVVHGDTKSSVLIESGLQVDLRVVAEEHFGAAVLYFTGSKAHNIKMRQRAIARGWTLNEYALAEVESESVVASHTEEGIYEALGMQWVPPPMREDHGEVEAAVAGRLPQVVDGECLEVWAKLPTECVLDARGKAAVWRHLDNGVKFVIPPLGLTDWDMFFDAIEEAGAAVVVDVRLDGLYPGAGALRRARDRRIPVVFTEFGDGDKTLSYAAPHAQRGWVRRDVVVNCWDTARLAEFLSET